MKRFPNNSQSIIVKPIYLLLNFNKYILLKYILLIILLNTNIMFLKTARLIALLNESLYLSTDNIWGAIRHITKFLYSGMYVCFSTHLMWANPIIATGGYIAVKRGLTHYSIAHNSCSVSSPGQEQRAGL